MTFPLAFPLAFLAFLAFLWLTVPRAPADNKERWQLAITLFTQYAPARKLPAGYLHPGAWEPFAAWGVWVFWRRKIHKA